MTTSTLPVTSTHEGQLEGTSQQYMSGYHTLDLTVSKDLFENRLNISAGCKNIFNVMLVNSFGSIDPHNTSDGSGAAGYGRTFFLSLRLPVYQIISIMHRDNSIHFTYYFYPACMLQGG